MLQFMDQLCRHYTNDKAHTDRMMRYGVEKLLVDERTRIKEKRRRTPSPDKIIYINHREYIVIDEWSEEQEKTNQEGKKSKDVQVTTFFYFFYIIFVKHNISVIFISNIRKVRQRNLKLRNCITISRRTTTVQM